MQTVLGGRFTSPAEKKAHRQTKTTDSAASCGHASQRELKHVYVCVYIYIYIYTHTHIYTEAATDSKLMGMIVLIRLKKLIGAYLT